MWAVFWHSEHRLDAVIAEDIGIPVSLFIAASIYVSDTAFDTVDSELIRCEANNGTQSCVSRVDRGSVILHESMVQDPQGGERSRPVSIGYFCERGEEDGIDDETVDSEAC